MDDIHQIRQEIGQKRQPRHSAALTEFQQLIEDSGRKNPFEFDRDFYRILLERAWFAEGSQGIPANVSSHQYLYRISTVSKIVRSTSWFARPGAFDKPAAVMKRLLRDYGSSKSWLRLSSYAKGWLKNPRKLTWWTTFEPEPMDIVRSIRSIGLTYDSVSGFIAILRLRADMGAVTVQPRVPTVLDACDYEVFHATKDADNPAYGITIDLRKSPPLVTGVDEYALGPVVVDDIEILPVEVNSTVLFRGCPHSEEMLWKNLEKYYKQLLID